MLKAISQLSVDVAYETDPINVIEALQHTAAAKAGVRVFAAYRLAKALSDPNSYHYGKNTFWDSKVSSGSYLEYMALLHKHGPSVLLQKAWRDARYAFTFTEALRAIKPSGDDRWVFDFYSRLGRRDGLFCPCGHWNLIFTSPTVLQLTPVYRGLLFAAANIAVSRMEAIIDHRGLDRREQPSLSPRELAVLQHLSRGQTIVESALSLAIQPGTVKTLLARAQKKLGTQYRIHAVAEALRRNLIS